MSRNFARNGKSEGNPISKFAGNLAPIAESRQKKQVNLEISSGYGDGDDVAENQFDKKIDEQKSKLV